MGELFETMRLELDLVIGRAWEQDWGLLRRFEGVVAGGSCLFASPVPVDCAVRLASSVGGASADTTAAARIFRGSVWFGRRGNLCTTTVGWWLCSIYTPH